MLSTGMQFCVKSWHHHHSLGLFQLNAWYLKKIEKKIENKKPSGIFLEKLGHFVLWPLHESRSACKTASVLKSLSSAHLLKTPVFFILHVNEQIPLEKKKPKTSSRRAQGFFTAVVHVFVFVIKNGRVLGICKSAVI